MVVIEMGSIRAAHNGDKSLPDCGLIIETTKDELAGMGGNFLYKEVKVVPDNQPGERSKSYIVDVFHTYACSVVVEAKDEKEAESIVEEAAEAGKILPEWFHKTDDLEIEVYAETKNKKGGHRLETNTNQAKGADR